VSRFRNALSGFSMFRVPSLLKALRLTSREVAFLGLSILIWAGYVVFLGKDTSWDFRNYHWYIPYALLNGRMGFDMLVAHQASYYNPYLDVPFYLLAQHTSSWFAIAVLGLFQAANIVPIYLLAREALRLPQNKLAAAALAFFSLTGGMTLSLYGTHYYDNVMSLFIMSGLAILVLKRETLAQGPLKNVFWWCALGGFLLGGSAGLKLPTAPFAMGFAAALCAIGGDRKHLGLRLAGGAVGGLGGFLLCEGPWMLQMAEQTGNPLFPYFNQYFHSPLALASPYRDMRFLPTNNFTAFFYPILFGIDYRVADDLPHNDIRIAIAYVMVIVAALCWFFGKRSKEPLAVPAAVRIVFVFVAATYFFWIKLFAIHRYILTLEMMAPLLIAMAVALLPLSKQIRLLGVGALFFLAMLFTRSAVLERAPLGDPYIDADLPKITEPTQTMVLMTGDSPLGFIAPLLPREVPILRVDGWMVQPDDGTALTRQMKVRVDAHRGPLILIADAYDMSRAEDALAAYNLTIDAVKCRLFVTNLIGAYQWCPLYRQKQS
jgi:hypothetical protein